MCRATSAARHRLRHAKNVRLRANANAQIQARRRLSDCSSGGSNGSAEMASRDVLSLDMGYNAAPVARVSAGAVGTRHGQVIANAS